MGVSRGFIDSIVFVKDLGIVAATARAAGAPAPLSLTALELFQQASKAGLGRRDDAAVALHLAGQAGITLPDDGNDRSDKDKTP